MLSSVSPPKTTVHIIRFQYSLIPILFVQALFINTISPSSQINSPIPWNYYFLKETLSGKQLVPPFLSRAQSLPASTAGATCASHTPPPNALQHGGGWLCSRQVPKCHFQFGRAWPAGLAQILALASRCSQLTQSKFNYEDWHLSSESVPLSQSKEWFKLEAWGQWIINERN